MVVPARVVLGPASEAMRPEGTPTNPTYTTVSQALRPVLAAKVSAGARAGAPASEAKGAVGLKEAALTSTSRKQL